MLAVLAFTFNHSGGYMDGEKDYINMRMYKITLRKLKKIAGDTGETLIELIDRMADQEMGTMGLELRREPLEHAPTTQRASHAAVFSAGT
jgi:hypothetical protein